LSVAPDDTVVGFLHGGRVVVLSLGFEDSLVQMKFKKRLGRQAFFWILAAWGFFCFLYLNLLLASVAPLVASWIASSTSWEVVFVVSHCCYSPFLGSAFHSFIRF
jgi:hypothetical protein